MRIIVFFWQESDVVGCFFGEVFVGLICGSGGVVEICVENGEVCCVGIWFIGCFVDVNVNCDVVVVENICIDGCVVEDNLVM